MKDSQSINAEKQTQKFQIKNNQNSNQQNSLFSHEEYEALNSANTNYKRQYLMLIVGLLIFLLIFASIQLYDHQKTQSILKKQFELQSKLISQVKDQIKKQLKNELMNGNKKLQNDISLIFTQQINGLEINNLEIKDKDKQQKIIPRVSKRNLKQPPKEDFSSFYCLKRPLIPNKVPQMGQREVLINTRHGFQLYGDAMNGNPEFMTKIMMNNGTFDAEGISLLGRLLRPGYKMLNLGAHTALQALVAANIVGPTGQLFLFQPSNFSYNLINKSFKLNNFTDRAEIYKLAVSDQKKKAKLFIDLSNTGRNALADNMQDYQKKIQKEKQYWRDNTPVTASSQDVQIDLVDNVLPPNIQIDFALIDVQSHQVQALRGMKQVIKRSPYLVIMIQWAYLRNQRKDPVKAKQIIQFLIERGYRFYKYSNFDPVQCVVGDYTQIKDPFNQLLNVTIDNFLFAPSTVILP